MKQLNSSSPTFGILLLIPLFIGLRQVLILLNTEEHMMQYWMLASGLAMGVLALYFYSVKSLKHS